MNRAFNIDSLFQAARDGNLDYLCNQENLLLLNTRNNNGESLLHIAAGYGKSRLASYLISQGADVNSQDLNGQAPLHNACCHGHYTTAKKLIDRGATVDLVDEKGWSPLHFALARKDNAKRISDTYWPVIELLLEAGANPHLESRSGRSCLERIKSSEERSKVSQFYLSVQEYFELVKQGDSQLLRDITTPKLLRSRLEICDEDKNLSNNITPLHRAAGYNHLEIAKFFVEKGADINSRDKFGAIPLHNAAKYGHIEMIEFLVSQGSDINTQDTKGYSPLHEAASNKTYRACLTLRALGADVRLKCRDGFLPYELAESDDVKEVLRPRDEIISAATDLAIYVDLPPTTTNEEELPQQRYSSILDDLMLDSSSNEPLFKNINHKIKKIILSESDENFQMIKSQMLNTIVSHDSGSQFSSYEILSIEKILNQKVWSNYRLMCQMLENTFKYKNEKLLFHGSNFIDDIQNYGFDEKYAQKNGMFGTGIYFAKHSSKSNQYTFGWGQGCKKHSDKSCYICERKIVYAQVALGRSLISKEAMPDCSHGPPGYSSVQGVPGSTDDLLYHEYVIYKGAQAYPLFVIRYRIVP